MKGSTHALIGVAASNVYAQINVHAIISNPAAGLYLGAAYIGALFCDLDTGSSTLSHAVSFIKSKHIRIALQFVFIAAGMSAVAYFRDSRFLGVIVAAVIMASLSFNRISSRIYGYIRRGSLICIAVGLAAVGGIYMHLPLIAWGILIGLFIVSPHRSFSHSLLALVLCTAAVWYTCKFYNLKDLSVSFGVGMASHMLADMLTERGIQLLFPWKKRIRFPVTTRTGSTVEAGIAFAAAIILVGSLVGM